MQGPDTLVSVRRIQRPRATPRRVSARLEEPETGRVSGANSEWFWDLWTAPTTRLPGEPFALPSGYPLRSQEHIVREPSPVDKHIRWTNANHGVSFCHNYERL